MNAWWRAGCAALLLGPALAAGSHAEGPTASRAAGFVKLAQHKDQKAPAGAKGKESTAKPAPGAEPAPAAELPAPQSSTAPVGEFEPVLHAQGAKITTCMDTIVGESAAVIDSAHTAISSWATAAPDANLFLSIIGLSYANKSSPNAAAILLAAPVGAAKCEGATVQVYPVAQSCSALQAALIKQGHTIAALRALPVVETKSGSRDVLIPTVGGGCVLVAVGLRQ